METTQDINSILSKLKKLQRLYEGAKAINSEAEAANAAAKIQNLLTQYNLSMADLDSVADDSQKSSVTEDQLDDRWSRKTGGAWDQLLLYGICKYNFCYTIVSQKHTSRITSGGRLVYEVRRKFIVIGEQQNIEVVKWLFAVLSRQLYELSKKRYKEYLADDSQALIRSFTGESACLQPSSIVRIWRERPKVFRTASRRSVTANSRPRYRSTRWYFVRTRN